MPFDDAGPFEIEWTTAALRQLRKLDKQVARRTLTAVTKLGTDPRPAGARAVSGQPAGTMRLRVGNYRLVHVIEDDRVVVTVVRVGHRGQVYRDL